MRRPGGFLSEEVRDAARRIVEDVRERGDEAVLEYTKRFSGVRPEPMRVRRRRSSGREASLPAEIEESFRVAIENVRYFHKRELGRSWETSRSGATVGQRIRPSEAGRYLRSRRAWSVSELVVHVGRTGSGGGCSGDLRLRPSPGLDGKVNEWVLAVAGASGA